jgi:hypothetical protein
MVLPSCVAERHSFQRNPRSHSVVVDWVEVMLDAIELNPPAPTATTWRMWVVASSMYDAWSAYDPYALSTQTGYELKRPRGERTEANKEAAVSYAAHRSLSFAYPEQAPMFDDLLDQLGLDQSGSRDLTTPEGVGNVAAQEVIDSRVQDGSNALDDFEQVTSEMYSELYEPVNSGDPFADNGILGASFDPNRWEPLRVASGRHLDATGYPMVDHQSPPSYVTQVFLTPHWGAITPFALDSGDQFRPPAPPQYGSTATYTDALGQVSTSHDAWHQQMIEIVELNAQLTDEHRVVAEFWADGPRTWTPPGHWVQLAVGVSLRDGHGIDQDAKMFMALTGALLDAGISSWDAKRVYDFIRPISAIRHTYAGQQILGWGGPNQGTRLIDGADWQPYQSLTFVTPPFAEYTSGHSTFSRAGAEVLTAFTGSPRMYDGVSTLGRDYDGDGSEDLFGQHVAVPGTLIFEDGPGEMIVLRWDTFYEASDEAGISRRYGGIHFQDADLRARQAGEQIGKQAFQWAQLYWDPFGEIGETIEQLSRSRDLTRQSRNLLLDQLHEAAVAVDFRESAEQCAQVAVVQGMLESQQGLTEAAETRLGRQLGIVLQAVCA